MREFFRLPAVLLKIEPEPSTPEAEAIAEALAAAAPGDGADARTAWWRTGVRENLAVDPEAARDRPWLR